MAVGNAIIGALRVVLGADTAQLEKGLKSAQGSVAQFGASAGRALATAGIALAGAAGAMGIAIKSAINQADELGKMAQKVGVPVEELSKLSHAADLSGVSVETLGKGMGRLARNTLEAAQGLQTPIRAFQALGIEFKNSDGRLKSVSELLPELADRFSKMRDGPEKTALAMQLLGRAGAELIPMLNMGKQGLQETMKEAEALGLVITDKTAKASEAFNDNLTRLSRVFTGIVNQVAANVVPILASLSEQFVEGAKNSGFMRAAVDVLSKAFEGLVRLGIVVYDNIGAIVKIFGIFIAANIGAAVISAGLAFVKMAAAIRAGAIALAAFELIRGVSVKGILLIAGIVALAAGAFDNFGEKIKKVGDWVSQFMPEGAGEAAKKVLEGMGLNLDGLTKDLETFKGVAGSNGGGLFDPTIINATKNALDSFIASNEKRIASMQAEIQTMGLGTYAREKLRISLEAESIAKTNNITITDKLRNSIDNVANAYALMADKIEGRRIWESTRTAAEEFGRTMEDLNGKRGSIDAETYERAVAQAQDRMVQANPYAQILGNSLETAFSRATESGAKFSEVLRSLLQDLARALANQAFRTLIYGNASAGGTFGGILGAIFGGGGGGVGLSGAGGRIPAFATGGSFQVGGSGGIDSQLMQFRATPGEMVNITKGDGGPNGMGALTVHVSLDSEMLRAYVQDESGKVVATAAPEIIRTATSESVQAVGAINLNRPAYIRNPSG